MSLTRSSHKMGKMFNFSINIADLSPRSPLHPLKEEFLWASTPIAEGIVKLCRYLEL